MIKKPESSSSLLWLGDDTKYPVHAPLLSDASMLEAFVRVSGVPWPWIMRLSLSLSRFVAPHFAGPSPAIAFAGTASASGFTSAQASITHNCQAKIVCGELHPDGRILFFHRAAGLLRCNIGPGR